MIPIPVKTDNGATFLVTGHFVRGEFRAVSVRSGDVEMRHVLAVTGRLHQIERFVEWELATAPT